MLGYVLKKLVSRLFFPVPLGLLLVTAGVAFLAARRRCRSGVVLTLAGVLVLVAAGYGIPGGAVLRRLEWRHRPPAAGDVVARLAVEPPRQAWIVVLGSGLSEDATLPATTRLDRHFLARLIEGVRLARLVPEARLVLSLPGRLAVADKEALSVELCEALALPADRTALITTARDTADEARLVAELAAGAPMALVTSAAHLPRALALFRGAGLDPLPCPTDYLTARPGSPKEFHPGSLYPSGGRMALSEQAVHELLGMAWARLRGQASRAVPPSSSPPSSSPPSSSPPSSSPAVR